MLKLLNIELTSFKIKLITKLKERKKMKRSYELKFVLRSISVLKLKYLNFIC